jgi:ATP-dependent Lon protease
VIPISNKNIYAKKKYYLNENTRLAKREYLLNLKTQNINEELMQISLEMADNYDAIDELDKKIKVQPCELNDKEKMIIEGLNKGKTLQDIAKDSGLSYSYVKHLACNLPK